jgi:crotonobetainyl-CoA:carnitine CoA-transferase CaiB-like acyl-CoA transferase
MSPKQSANRAPRAAQGPLAGLTVLDLTTVIMGPYAMAMLGDMGAQVIKVEPPSGDVSRYFGEGVTPGMGPLTLNLQRNKQSVVLDLARPADRRRLDDLVSRADALVTNLRPASREKLGLTYERLSAVRGDIVFCTAQAYSSLSERADRPAYDDIVQAASGFAMIPTLAGERPAYTRSVIADKVCAYAINQGVLAALLHRQRTGEGQWVDVPMVDTMVNFNLVEHLFQATRHDSGSSVGWTRVLSQGREPMRTSDARWICLLPYSDRNWHDLLRAIEREDLVDDERVRTMNNRNANMGFLLGVVAAAVAGRPASHWLEVAERLGIPATELLDLGQASADPYLIERGVLVEATHPLEGRYWAFPVPTYFSKTPVAAPRPAPALGADTEVLVVGQGPDHSPAPNAEETVSQ